MEMYPLFPLELIVFPLEELNLHIFEPRYRQLVLDSQHCDQLFGIPCFRKNEELKYGTLVRLVGIEKKYTDGKMDIRTEGVCAFEISEYLEVFPKKLYPGGKIKKLDLDLKHEISKCLEIKEKVFELYEVMNIKTIPKALNSDSFFTFQIAHKVGLNQDQEFLFLQIRTEIERQEYLIRHLEILIPMARNMEEMRKKVQLNGHFKDILPPKV